MNIDRVGQWVGIVANVGVLLGFILVAYQLQLNTTALQTTSKHKTNELLSNAEMALMGDTGNAAFAHALLDPESVTPEEMVQIWSYFSLSFLSVSQVFFDYRDGLVSEERWQYAADLYISGVPPESWTSGKLGFPQLEENQDEERSIY